MDASKRIVINTLAQHIRSVVNIGLSLYSTRLILQALGQVDFGVYSLVAGVVAMLGFLTNAMVVTTQRQLSFYHGRGAQADVRRMFSNSLLLHIVLGLFLSTILVFIEPLLFNGFLVIEPSRTEAASVVYFLVILSLFITFLTAPYRAIFIARENIVYISVIDVIDGVLKLGFALWLLHCPFDRLIAYAWIMTGIMFFNFLALAIWAKKHFSETLFLPRRSDINKAAIKELTSFAGWTMYSLGCIIGRTQGVAIILNRFFGTVINASYGIAQQVSGAIHFVAQAITNAISPQIVKAESMGDRQRMLHLSELLSKYAFLLLAIIVVPLCFEMSTVLQIWLGNVPSNAITLCQFTLIASLCDQTTIGLGIANQAIGRIRNYSLTINTIKVLTLPVLWCVLRAGYSIDIAMWCYVGFECLCAIGRLFFLKYTAGLSIQNFAKSVFARIAIPMLTMLATSWVIVTYSAIPLRFLLTGATTAMTAIATIWIFAMEPVERTAARKMLHI